MTKSILCGLFLASLGLLMSCSETAQSSKEPISKKSKKPDSNTRISSIEITQFKKVTTLRLKHEKDGSVNVSIQPFDGNADAHLEFNKDRKIREVISGRRRLQYLFGTNNEKVGILSDNGQSQIMFEYQNDQIITQYTILGNDTVGTYRYTYENGLPATVEITGANDYFRSYTLTYSDVPNSLTDFYEMVLPTELAGQLGIPAMYAENYLQRATRTDLNANEKEPLKESYTPSLKEIRFEISSSGMQESLNYVSDGSRQWSAVIKHGR